MPLFLSFCFCFVRIYPISNNFSTEHEVWSVKAASCSTITVELIKETNNVVTQTCNSDAISSLVKSRTHDPNL